MSEAKAIVIGQAPRTPRLNKCGCCRGLLANSAVETANSPGLNAIAYRIGTHSLFKQNLLAEMSTSRQAALDGLKTRDDDDFSIALADAFAVMADVLTFYQERIANESFLRTAAERRSVLELARLVGYELSPGVAADTYLAFTLEDAPGAPRQTTIQAGNKVQSVPGPGEKPQTFETIESIEARPEWNALKAQLNELRIPKAGAKHVYLKGTSTNLKPGDALLFIEPEWGSENITERWDLRKVKEVFPDSEAGRTLVKWDEGLGSVHTTPADNPKVYALRQQAALFGHNAPDIRTLPKDVKKAFENDEVATAWSKFNIAYLVEKNTSIETLDIEEVYLDRIYPMIIPGSWLVLSVAEEKEVYKVKSVSEASQTNFTLTAKTTRVELNPHVANDFKKRLRDIIVYAQSELLEFAEESLMEPVYGSRIPLNELHEELYPGQTLIVSGRRPRVRVLKYLELTLSDGSKIVLKAGDSLQILSAPLLVSASDEKALEPAELADLLSSVTPSTLKWHLIDGMGNEGILTADSNLVAPHATDKSEPEISEVVFIKGFRDSVITDRYRTTINLANTLANVYDRATVSINANVARATHGETVQEVVGSGDAGRPYQSFTLRQPPLTYVSADTPSGAESTLQVRVNDILWKEVPALYGHSPNDRVYITRTGDDGKTTVRFGDGITGSRLPSGHENVRATYRKGIGMEGLARAGQLSLLMTRPLGVKGVTNPLKATGADDRESLDGARRNAPFTALTLERIVSLRDYEDFARTFSGIAKALATWTWDGHKRAVYISVAGPKGAGIGTDSRTYENLSKAVLKYGDPFVRVVIKSYRPSFFRVEGKVKVRGEYQREKVLVEVEKALRSRFSFEAREFGQPVTFSEVVAVMQGVDGVEAVDIDKLYRHGEAEIMNTLLVAKLPDFETDNGIKAAELLTLDPAPIELGEMK